MDNIILFVIGFWLGAAYAGYKIRKQIFKIAKDQGIDVSNVGEPEIKTVPILQVEKHNDMLYLFENKSNEFMCQGISIEELADKLIKYKQVDVAFVKHGAENFWFVNGKVKSDPNES
jgi:hypothetical protein